MRERFPQTRQVRLVRSAQSTRCLRILVCIAALLLAGMLPGFAAPSTAQAATYTLWSGSTVPSVVTVNDRQAVELGLKFRTDVDGRITAIRFYKGPSNTGPHVGNLWTASGTRLANVTFTNETASGWQQATLPAPVAVTANTTYVVSYHTGSGFYSANQRYFSSSGVDAGPLHAPANGTSANGVYRYGSSSGFPTQSYNASNYWVDVVFEAATGTPAAGPEPAGWYAGDMHVHRSCGGPPEPIANMYAKMAPQNLAVISLLADMGNGEVQDPSTDLPRVTGQDDPLSSPGRTVHWDAEWHWDAIYFQFPHQALGGHVVALGLTDAEQIWEEYTYPIFRWARRQNGIAGFAHMQYLDNAIPQGLTCCTPLEYPVEVALGAADFISEDVGGGEPAVQAYYRLLNTGFRPGFAAGTDYPCNFGADLGTLLTYVKVEGPFTYRKWVEGIAQGRTVVSRNGHNEFLNLTVDTTASPGDEIRLPGPGSLPVTVTWTANQALTGTIELVHNGVVVASRQASVGQGAPATLTTVVNITKSGWLAARRMGNSGRQTHTGAVFVTVAGAPIRASAADADFYVQWMDNLLQKTSPGGVWSSYFLNSRDAAQARYRAAKALFRQIALEAGGASAPVLSSIAVTPAGATVSSGSTQQFTATGVYSDGSTLDITAQAGWASSNTAVAPVNRTGLALAAAQGGAVISATLAGVSGSAPLNVANVLTITTASVPAGMQGIPYSATLAVSGGTPPYAWTITAGALPPGLQLDSGTGVISGTPTAVGSFGFTVRVNDASGAVPGSATFTLPVTAHAVYTLWSAATAPGVIDAGPDSPVELGVKFRSDVDGVVSGIRFYKSSANTGVHVANLWTGSGTRLATATFSNETASGWQQVSFPTPVPITANTVYVASYHTAAGHYSNDQNYFLGRGVDRPPLHALADGASGADGVYAYGPAGSFPVSGWRSSNYWVDVVFMAPGSPDTTPPTVLSLSPPDGSSGVSTTASVTATFSEAMDPATVTAATVELRGPSNVLIASQVSYDAAAQAALLRPDEPLAHSTQYTARVKGGAGGVKDASGNALAADAASSFTTAAPPPPPPAEGPGGPILVIAHAANPFSRYYAEILRTEGFNYFEVVDLSQVSAQKLSRHEVVILGETALSDSQVGLLSAWVEGGGNLIAMRPDKKLAFLLGLADAGSTLSNAYLLVGTAPGPGRGIVNQTIQFHGTADLYALNGASSLAALYATATTAASGPAVTIREVGSNGGTAAAFAYDLARSVVYTRQGNPAWSGQDRDGLPPIRSNDLFYGAAAFDPRPDWVDLSKVAIPQADEQQRLLANLIIHMNFDKKPLPRFWYFPRRVPAVVIMTGDDHGSGGTAARFDGYLAASTPGCSVENWECIRGSSYVYPGSVTAAQAAAYDAAGLEVALHVDTGCADWTAVSLDAYYTAQLQTFRDYYPGIPAPVTHRTHCIAWSDYDTQPQVELSHGIRLDTNYYYWPASWVNNRPGFFTGSGMPMRFAKRDGTPIDAYQAATQMTDESGQTYPSTVTALLDKAVGPEGYYGAFTANMHTDSPVSTGSDAIIAAARERQVPIVSSRQMLRWLDGRNSSSFSGMTWNGTTLAVTIAAGQGAQGLTALLPQPAGLSVSSITRDGIPVTFSLSTVKGIEYALFDAVPGSYRVDFAVDGTPPSVTGVSPADGASGVGVTTTVTATFSESMDAATVNATSFTLRHAAGLAVPAAVSYDSQSVKATLTPSAPLAAGTVYTATVAGGAAGVRDAAGNPLAADYRWSFTTAAGGGQTYSLWTGTEIPTLPAANDTNAVELGVKFSSAVPGYVVGIRFYKGTGNNGPHVGNLWTATGTLVATVTFAGETASGWQYQALQQPAPISANTTYIVSYHAPQGRYSADVGYFSLTGVDRYPLRAPASSQSGGNGVFRYGPGGFPNGTWNGTNYWVDVVFQP